MSITANLERISTAKENIKNKLIEKGVDVPANARLDEFPDMFDQIQTGGGSNEWASIGYAAPPQYILDDIAYSKEIYDNWNGTKITFKDKMVYAPNVDVSNIDNLNAFYEYNNNLIYAPIVIKNNVKSLFGIFSNCTKLQILKESNWDTSNVTNMGSIFYSCSSLQTLDVSNWNTSNATNMVNMFNGCTKLQTLDVSNWDTSNVTDMNGIFSNCNKLQTLDVSNWDTSNVTDMQYMFNNCSSLTTLDVSNWDTSNVTNMNGMFNNCSLLTTLDVSNWDTSNVTNIGSIFSNCTKLQTIDVSNWDTSNMTNYYMSFGSTKIKEVIGCFDVNKCDNSIFNYMYFIGYSSNSYLRKFTLKNFGRVTNNLTSGTETYQTFKNMTNWGVDDDDVTGAKQSVIDTLITYSVDRISEGYNPNVVCSITLSANTKALLTEDEIAQITAKGYTIA